LRLFGFPYLELRLDPAGVVWSESDRAAGWSLVGDTGSTDLLVLVHGWASGDAAVRRLYRAVAARCADGVVRVDAMRGRRLAVLGVLWPAGALAADEIAGGGAGGRDCVTERLYRLGATVGDPALTGDLAAARPALAWLDRAETARRDFVDAVRAALAGVRQSLDSSEELPQALVQGDGAEVFDRLARPVHAANQVHGGSAAPILLGGVRHAAANLLDLAAYLVGQDRASAVGLLGLAPALREIQSACPEVRVHVAGHGLGTRVACAAGVAGVDAGRPGRIASLALLQGAQSDVGFAASWAPGRDGAFRRCLTGRRVEGPILVTHTGNDQALGAVYAIAQGLAADGVADGAGGLAGDAAGGVAGCAAGGVAGGSRADGRCGGLGRHGARLTAEAVDGELGERDARYEFRPGVIHNLRADAVIPQHDAIASPEVANALLHAVSWSAG
jgi:hypothetical protein